MAFLQGLQIRSRGVTQGTLYEQRQKGCRETLDLAKSRHVERLSVKHVSVVVTFVVASGFGQRSHILFGKEPFKIMTTLYIFSDQK